jgi:hypothetical protein
MSNLDKELEIARLREREREASEREHRDEATGWLVVAGIAAAAWARDKAEQRRQKRRRARAVSDPAVAYAEACEKLQRDRIKLTKKSIAAEMEIGPDTLNRYIQEYGLTYPPRR